MFIRKEFIIIIVILCKIYCRVGISTYEGLHTTEIEDGLCIRANGSISPIGEFISERLNLMFSIRFLSPGVDVNYSLYVTDNENDDDAEDTEKNIKIELTRDFDMDVAYRNLSSLVKNEEKETTYLEDYHQTVIRMFPSLTGSLSIHTSRNDSFIRFLEFEHVSKHKIDILACLFLLAEGADIPLNIEGDKINPMLVLKEIIAKPTEQKSKPEIKQNSKEEKNKFSISMKGMCSIKKTDNTFQDKNVLQTSAADVINFFIDNKTNPDIREGGKYAEPTTHEEFNTGKFLYNARWLIQYYIFKYLDSEDSIIEFAKTVYSMLKECIATKKDEKSKELNEEVKYLENIVNKCFVKSSDANTINAMHRIGILTTIYKESSLANIFPFVDGVSAPDYRSVPSYNRKEDSFNSRNIYSNCVESGLLSLFCCLAYDPKTKEYNIDHMGDVSSGLKRFFDKYNKPFETDTYEIHNDWSKVVADLENENIRYLKENRNELAPGIINMLYVIAEITGRYSKEEESLKELCTLLKKGGNKNQSELFAKVRLYTEKLISSLSKTYTAEENSELARREVKIEILKMSKCSNIKKQVELFGEVVITYRYLKFKGGVKLYHTAKYLYTTAFSIYTNILGDAKFNQLVNNKKSIDNESEKTLTDFLLMHRAELMILCIKNRYYEHKENLKMSGENNYSYPIEKFFLYKSHRTNESRMCAIHCVRVRLIGYPMKENDQWSRFLSNMIGSLPLNNFSTLKKIFFNPMYRGGLYNTFCKKVNIPLAIVDKYNNTDGDCLNYQYYINNSNLLSGYLELLKLYLLTKDDENCFLTSVVKNMETHSKIKLFSALTHDGTSIDPLLEIEAFLSGLDRSLLEYEKTTKPDDTWVFWLKLSLESEKFNNITSILFDKIVIDTNLITVNGIKHEYTDENINISISNLKEKYPSKVVEHVLNLIETNFEYAKKLSYLMKKYNGFFTTLYIKELIDRKFQNIHEYPQEHGSLN
ncbi:hypothetical protein NEIRO03_1383 [Nematocida sp. AWRm78]|nr:hypothetical protein NEIRO03_1383 [Nematocida sp. AWRm78]